MATLAPPGAVLCAEVQVGGGRKPFQAGAPWRPDVLLSLEAFLTISQLILPGGTLHFAARSTRCPGDE